METNFLTDNFVVIILIAVIIFMTIIGYIADKKDFGKKDKDKKIDKKNKKKDDQEQVDIGQEILAESNEEFIDASQPEVLPTEENIVDSFEMPTDIEPVEDQFTAPEVSSIEEQNSNEEIQPAFDSNLVESNEEIQPASDLAEDSQSLELQNDNEEQPESTNQDDNAVEKNDLEQNVNDNTEDNKELENDTSAQEQPVSSEWNVDESTSTDNSEANESVEQFDLPNIENFDEQLMDNADDEDVWKF